MDWKEYMKQGKALDYMIFDPPWNFNDKPPKATSQLTYDLWLNNQKCADHIFKKANASCLFIWVPSSLLDVLLCASMESPGYRYKTLMTWVKTTKHGKIHYGLGNWFRNSTEQLAVFGRVGARPIKLTMRNAHHAPPRSRTGKPRDFERELVYQLGAKGYRDGAYVFSGIDELDMFDVFNIDMVDMEFGHE